MPTTTETPSFVAFEGIEGSGKGVQLKLLEQEFRSRKLPFISTREPGGTLFGSDLRQILLRTDGPAREPLAELLLYLADRYQHIKQVIEPSLNQGLHVLCDRYHDATLAYQGHARGLGFSRIDELARLLDIRMPDLTLVLVVEVELGLSRARQRNTKEKNQDYGRFEAEDVKFHQKVQAGYKLLAKREAHRITLIDASGTPQQVFRRILEVLRQRGIIGDS